MCKTVFVMFYNVHIIIGVIIKVIYINFKVVYL